MLHAFVDRPVQNVLSLKKFDHLTHNVEKCEVEYRVIGQLESSGRGGSRKLVRG
jgi:hypothetical protein